MQQKYVFFLPVIVPKNDWTPSSKLYYFTTLNEGRFNVTFVTLINRKRSY